MSRTHAFTIKQQQPKEKSCTLKIDVEIDAKLLPTKHQQKTKGSRGNNDSSLSNVITYSNCNGFLTALSKYKEDKTHPFVFCIITGPKNLLHSTRVINDENNHLERERQRKEEIKAAGRRRE